MSQMEPGLRIERLTELEQFDRCVNLQTVIWNYSAGDLIPRRMFLLASRIGGQVLGAFAHNADAADVLCGFAMGLPGYRRGHAYLHSHMVGVLPEFRNRGVARALKTAQRDDALERGFDLMEWTFDPLEIKNAHLNIARLGAISRRYQRDFYGPSSSPLQGGLPTDRLYAEWWLRSTRVQRVLAGETSHAMVERVVEVPAEIYEWKASALYRESARSVQAANAAELEAAFANGLAVLGYERGSEGQGRFLLGRWDEDWQY